MARIPGGTVHMTPPPLRRRLLNSSKALVVWTSLTPLARNEYLCWILSAKKEETRRRREEIALDKLGKGERRPCCFAGCPHR